MKKCVRDYIFVSFPFLQFQHPPALPTRVLRLHPVAWRVQHTRSGGGYGDGRCRQENIGEDIEYEKPPQGKNRTKTLRQTLTM